ncbi:MAG: hypothetical protein GY754_13165 [bacterium]|nr:hypothetical protein [bacterium]
METIPRGTGPGWRWFRVETAGGTFQMELFSTSTVVPEYTVPVAPETIIEDGDPSDWSSISTMITDDTGDGSARGSDIDFVKVAVDASNTTLYVLMKTATDGVEADISYSIQLRYTLDSATTYKKKLYAHYGSGWEVSAYDEGTRSDITGITGAAAASGQYIEFSCYLAPLGTPPGKLNLEARTYANSGDGDYDQAPLFGYLTFP